MTITDREIPESLTANEENDRNNENRSTTTIIDYLQQQKILLRQEYLKPQIITDFKSNPF